MLIFFKHMGNLGLQIDSKNYGRITVFPDENVKIGNGYFVTATTNGVALAGFIDENGQEIIPLEEMELEEFFSTKRYQNICFGFRIPEIEVLKYYHLQRGLDNHYRIRITTDPFEQEPIVITNVNQDSELWLMEKKKKNNEAEYALYCPDEVRILTPFFDELNLDIDANPYGHFAYFCSYIFATIDSNDGSNELEQIILTSVCGFIDRNGNFSSQLLDVEDADLYNCYLFGKTSTSREFQQLLFNLQQKYLNRYYERDQIIDEILNDLFNQPNQSVKPLEPKKSQMAKIIQFKKTPKL